VRSVQTSTRTRNRQSPATPRHVPDILFPSHLSPPSTDISARKSKMPWRDIVFTPHGMVLPPSWPGWTAASTDAVRHGHACARARCISDEERVLLDKLAQTEWTAATKDNDASTIPSVSRCASDAITPTSSSRRGSATLTAAPSISWCNSVVMATQEPCLRHDAAAPRRGSLTILPPADERAELPTETSPCNALRNDGAEHPDASVQ